MARHDWALAVRCASVAVEADATDYEAHKLKAMAHDRGGELVEAFAAYEAALSLKPDGMDLLQPLAQLAFRLNQMDVSAAFYAMLLARSPEDLSIIDAYAITLRELGRYEIAISLCQTNLGGSIGQTAASAPLWATLGTILSARGDHETALIFFNQSLELKDNPAARFHLACALTELGRFDEALPLLEACLEAFRDPDNRASVAITHAQTLLAAGRLAEGWQAYAAVREKKDSFNELHFDLKVARLEPDAISGRDVLIVAEQGLGDEVLFSTLLADIVATFKPATVTLSVEPRLRTLKQRSFPAFRVISHKTQTQGGRLTRYFDDIGNVSGFVLLGDFLPALRSHLTDFKETADRLTPDPARIQHWRDWLSTLPKGPKIGLTWKSLKADTNRDRFYASFESWTPLLGTSGVSVISLQYGDTLPERQWAASQGLSIIVPPGIDPLNDLDDLAALSTALDAVAGPSNATTNIATACGVRTYMYAPYPQWIFLGADHHPFYPSVQLFLSDPPGKPEAALSLLIPALLTEVSAPYKD